MSLENQSVLDINDGDQSVFNIAMRGFYDKAHFHTATAKFEQIFVGYFLIHEAFKGGI